MSLSDRIQTLKRKQDAILARIKNAQAKQAKEERALSTRQKVLIGVATLRGLERGLITNESLIKLLTDTLAEKDLKLFNL